MDFSRFLPWDSGEIEVANNILVKCLKLYGEILSGNLIRYYDYYVGKSISRTDLTFINNKNYNQPFIISDSAIIPGKWYWEHKVVINGVIKIGVATNNYPDADSTWFYCSNGTITNKTTIIEAPTYTVDDIIGIALDTEKGFIYFSKNNVFVSALTEEPLFNNLYGSELFSCMELDTNASITILFENLNYSVTNYNNGIYDYVTNVERGLEELQFFWDVYKTKVLNKYKSVLDPNDIVKKIQDIKNISNNHPVGNPSEQAYFLNLPELLKSKGTVKSLQGIFNFFGIAISVVPWYDPGYLSNQRTGVLIRLTFGGENVANEEIYEIVEQLVYLVLDVCAILVHIDVFKEFSTTLDELQETSDDVVVGTDKCTIDPEPASARPDVIFVPMFSPPFKGYFTGLNTCNSGSLPNYSGLFSTYCPYLYDCYEVTRPIDIFIKDPSLVVGGNRNIIGVTDGKGNLRLKEYLRVSETAPYVVTLKEIPEDLFVMGSEVMYLGNPTLTNEYSINNKILLFNVSQAGTWMSVAYHTYYDGLKTNVIEPVYGEPYLLTVSGTLTRAINDVSVFPSYITVEEVLTVGSKISWYPFIAAWNEVLIVKDLEIRSVFPIKTVTFNDLDTPWLVQPISDLYPIIDMDFNIDPDLDFDGSIFMDFSFVLIDSLNVDSNTESISEVAWNEEINLINKEYLSSDFPELTESKESIEKSYIEEIGQPTTDLSLIDYQNFSDSSDIKAQWDERRMSYAWVDGNNIEWPYFHYYGIITLPSTNPVIGDVITDPVGNIVVGDFVIGGAYNFIRDLTAYLEEFTSDAFPTIIDSLTGEIIED